MQNNSTVDEIIKMYPRGRQESLIPMLQEIQDRMGCIPEIAIKIISKHLQLPSSTVYGVASFYNQFRFHQRGKYHIQLCYGTACYLFGASTFLKELEKILKITDNETTADGLFSLELQSCIGGCGQAPIIAINGEYYGNLTLEKLQQLIDDIIINEKRSIV